jgi:hypothetical protein
MGGDHPNQTTLPAEDMKPAYIAYRKVRQTGQLDQPAHVAARAAVRALHPEMCETEASALVVAAVHYASVHHAEWLWHRVGDPKWWK